MLRKGRWRARRRRLDMARMKARAKRLYPHDQKARCANHLAVCSCFACGNPRKHFDELTMQERRFQEKARFEEARLQVES